MPRDRECGGCTACCKTHAVASIDKPMGVWCPHCTIGVGCKIYASRPNVCQLFKCSWLTGTGTDDMRPDKSHAVLMLKEEKVFFKQKILEVTEVTPGAARNGAIRALIEDFLSKRTSVLIVTSGQKAGTFILSHGTTLPYNILPVLKEEKIDVLTPEKYFSEP